MCASPGVNLLVGTENGLKLLDRSGQGKVYPLINSRRFQQMDVLEGLNLLITISGNYCCCYHSGKANDYIDRSALGCHRCLILHCSSLHFGFSLQSHREVFFFLSFVFVCSVDLLRYHNTFELILKGPTRAKIGKMFYHVPY